jgi:hypothetical protein
MAVQLVKTLAEQAHLCPFPLPVKPVLWNYDHVLRLYPLPHITLLADQTAAFTVPYGGGAGGPPYSADRPTSIESDPQPCIFANPGSFARDLSFALLYPLVGQFDVYSASDASR